MVNDWTSGGDVVKGRDSIKIRPAASGQDWDQVKRLFLEYVEWISHAQGIDLGFQGIEDELKSLPGAFSTSDGCMLLAEIDGYTAGCVALRRLGAEICERKRLYVKPEYRAKGVGRALVEQIIREAKSRGYQFMRLDTLNTMKAAQGLYCSLGFKPTQQYYDVPHDVIKRTVFFELSLE